ncbi:MAG: ABC transporter permease subunit [Planctomycetales bacterium]|nr:ABC transporter permease subunit [Planctomycetales bacterium]
MSAELQSPPPTRQSQRRQTRPSIRLWRLTRKELRETLRDRRTIITLVLMPLLVYPLLSVAFRQFFFSSSSKATDIEWRIAAENEQILNGFGQQLALGSQVIDEIDGPEKEPPHSKLMVTGFLEKAVRDGDVDLAIRARIDEGPGMPRGGQIHYELIYQKDSALSRAVADYIERRLWGFNQRAFGERMQRRGGSPEPIAKWNRRPLAGESVQVISMATLVPLILILMTITGAVYPAIDLTAGERERGTLESLMAAPLPRLSMLLAKYFAVLTVALLTAVANLVGMSITVYSTGLGPILFGERSLTPSAIVIVLLLLVLFAAFFSALLLAVTSFARSFKEAQAYLIPFMLLAIAPGFLSVMPGIELSGVLAVVPLVNIVLLARDVLQGEIDPPLALAAVVSTALYGVAALALAARIFGSDAILYGSQGSWADLFRRPEELRNQPSLAGAALCAAVVFALQNVLSGLFALGTAAMPLETRLLLSAALGGLLYLVVPLGVARFQFVSLLRGFQLRIGPILAYVGALCLGLSLWVFAHEIVLLTQGLNWMSVDFKKLANAEIFEQIKHLNPWLLVGTMAIAPAVCEEWFFRGYLLGSLRGRLPGWGAIAATGILFGLFHVFVSGGVGGVRLLPSTLLGLVLGWICWRTKSVFPGMLLHATHNGLLVLIGRYQDDLAKVGIGVEEKQHLPALWLVVAACGVVFGIAIVWVSTRWSSISTVNAKLQPSVETPLP